MAELRLKICQQMCSVCRPTVTLLHRSVELDVHWTRCRSTLLAEAECVLPFIHRIQAEISRSALNVTVTVTARSTATCSFTLVSNAQKASLSGTKETRL